MPTTTVDTISVALSPSRSAVVVKLILFQLGIGGMVLCPWPLVVIAFMGWMWIQLLYQDALLIPALSSSLTVYHDGRIEYDTHQGELEQILNNLAQWGLVLKMRDGTACLLWRDSCDDASYRALMVYERHRQMTR